MENDKHTYFFLLGDLLWRSEVCTCFTGVTRPASGTVPLLLGVTGTGGRATEIIQ